MIKIYDLKENYDEIFDNIIEHTLSYLFKNQIQTMVIGLSGGIDSTLCAVLGKYISDITTIDLIGVSMPIVLSNNYADVNNSVNNIGKFCDKFITLNRPMKLYIDYMKTEFNKPIEELTYDEKIRGGNIQARLRMIELYNLASKNKGLVLSTDNFTEYLLGFWTLHGDVGDFGMIQNLWKTEIYGLSKYIRDLYILDGCNEEANCLQKSIDAIPTDGLGITNSDFDQIGVNSYDEVDQILFEYIYLNKNEHKNHPVIKMYRKNAFKRTNPYNIKREITIR